MAIAEALSAVTASINLAREISKVDRELDLAELKMNIATLTSQLADAQLAMVDVQKQMTAKDEAIEQLKADFERKCDLVESDFLLYEADANNNPIGHPFCQRCIDVDQQLVKAVRRPATRADDMICPQCRTEFRGRVKRPEAGEA